MSRKPAIRNGKPALRDGKPLVDEEPCACCGGDCPPCGECTSGWASGRVYPTLNDVGTCNGMDSATIEDTSTPPAGYCYSHSVVDGVTFDRTTTVSIGYLNCTEFEITSFATCCDPEKCGGCSDTATVYGNFVFCCCYGAECVEGTPTVIGFPGSVTMTCDSSSGPVGGTGCTNDRINFAASVLPGTYSVPLVSVISGSAKYLLEFMLGEPGDDCTQLIRFEAFLDCGGLALARICVGGCAEDDDPPFETLAVGSIRECHGTYANPTRVAVANIGGFNFVYEGFSITW